MAAKLAELPSGGPLDLCLAGNAAVKKWRVELERGSLDAESECLRGLRSGVHEGQRGRGPAFLQVGLPAGRAQFWSNGNTALGAAPET